MSESGAVPVLAVGAVVRRGDDLLLVKRGRPPGAGLWSLPGGRVEPSESLREAVVREVREETGLEVRPAQLLGWVERRGPGWHFVICDFAAEMVDRFQVPEAGDDAAEVGFVPAGNVEGLPLVDGLMAWLLEHGALEPAVLEPVTALPGT